MMLKKYYFPPFSQLNFFSIKIAGVLIKPLILKPVNSLEVFVVFINDKLTSKCTLEHPSGVIPRAAKGTLKVAFSDATMASQSVADVTQAPMAGPLAAIKIGWNSYFDWTYMDRKKEQGFYTLDCGTVLIRITYPAELSLRESTAIKQLIGTILRWCSTIQVRWA